MKKIFLFFFITTSILLSQENSFNRGVNLSGWFQTDGPRQIQFSKYTKKTFEQMKSLGIDVVRLPINLHSMTDGTPNYNLDSIFIYFLDQVVDWSEELEINLILDNHTFDVNQSTDTNIDQILIPVWTNMALHFQNRSTKLYYEVLNEPHGISDTRWNQIQQSVVNAIRSVDQKHTIIVGPANWNSYNNLSAMPVYSDINLIYTFHFYEPFIFTHQGASWTDLGPLSDIPFPYDASRMPSCPPELIGTWVQTSMNNYSFDGTVSKVQSLLNVAVNFQKSRNAKLFCGEFGVYNPYSPDSDRVYWYGEIRKYLAQNNIPWTIWDYRGGFGLFDKYSNELFEYDLNIPLLVALGFNTVPQSEYIQMPDTTQFYLYSDFIGENIYNASYSSTSLDFYNSENPYSGAYCIYWNGAQRYGAIAFDFLPNKDLSILENEGYVFECKIKGNLPNTSFDIRFVDSKSGTDDHPWRMGFKINQLKIGLTNEWQTLRVSLKDFYEFGSYDINTWYNPIGLFDWKDIDRFEIVAEDSSLIYSKLWFDEIKIYNPDISGVTSIKNYPSDFKLEQNFPNPFNPITKINYSFSKDAFVELKVINLLGKVVETLVNKEQEAGNYSVNFNALGLSSGVYFYQIRTGDIIQTKKMILLR